ncbi:hypothetical protein CSUI_007461, partial [Cystoisospora suis]
MCVLLGNENAVRSQLNHFKHHHCTALDLYESLRPLLIMVHVYA